MQFTVGQLIRNLGGEKTRSFLLRSKLILKKISETSLLFVIFCAMSESFYNGLDATAIEIAVMFLIVFCIHTSSLTLVWNVSGCRGSKSEGGDTAETVSGDTVDGHGQNKMQCKDECMKFDIYDRIAILFCSSQKTAAFGIPIVTSLYETSPHLGIYLVPLLMYPPIQLLCASLLVQPLSSRVAKWRESRKPHEESSLKCNAEETQPHVGAVSTSEVEVAAQV